MTSQIVLAVALLATIAVAKSAAVAPAPASQPMRVTVEVDASNPLGELRPIWRFFGYDEPNYTYMTDGRRLIGELGKLGERAKQPVYVRCHSLLVTGDGTPTLKWGSTNAYTED